MIGAIPNPTKTVQVNYPFETCESLMNNFNSILNKYQMKGYELETIDSVLNTWIYKKSELLSFGVKILISLQPNGDKTQFNIEVQREIGAFDRPHEVTFANNYINDLMRAISMGLNPPSAAEEQNFIAKQEINNNSDSSVGMIFVFFVILFMVYMCA